MRQLELTAKMPSQYRELTAGMNRLVAAQVKASSFEHLRSPNTRGSTAVSVGLMKARPKIIVRPEGMPATGRRSLEAGHLEILLVATAPLADPFDYKRGLDISCRSEWGRLVVGQYLTLGEIVVNELESGWRENVQSLRATIYSGNYSEFVSILLPIMDNALEQYKRIFGEYEANDVAKLTALPHR